MGILVLWVGSLSAVPAAASDDLHGIWLTISAVRQGEPAVDVIGHRATFDRARFEIRARDGSLLFEGSYTLEPDKSPPAIDFRHTGGVESGTIWKGIYDHSGTNELTICDNAPDPEMPRPTALHAPEGSDYICLLFERSKGD